MKKFIIILLFLSIYSAYGQTDTVARVDILTGGSVTFHFNSYAKISNGIEYTNWTNLKAYFVATNAGVPTAAQWRLTVRSNTANIVGDGGNILDTRTVQVSANSAGQGTDQGWVSLTNADVLLVNNGTNPINTATIVISYRCGMDVAFPILGESSDYYFVDLVFTLELI